MKTEKIISQLVKSINIILFVLLIACKPESSKNNLITPSAFQFEEVTIAE